MLTNFCIQCGNLIPKKGVKFCSLACVGVFNRGKSKPEFSNLRDDHPAWKGGQKIDRGYRMILVGIKKYRFEHRLIFEKFIGRPLKRREFIHHWNKNKLDNRLENLSLFRTSSPHMRLHGFARKQGLNIESLKFEQTWLAT